MSQFEEVWEENRRLRAALEKVWQAFDGGPYHPWIPGGNAIPIYPIVAEALGHPVPKESDVLGYRADGRPIHPPKPGRLYSQAFIHCVSCEGVISHVSGPARGSICIKCHEDRNAAVRSIGDGPAV